MRLINVHDFTTTHFFTSNLPKYAILSHRWAQGEGQEARLDDIKQQRNQHTLGYQKVVAFTNYVRNHIPTVHWVWIDTCCIDQNSGTELPEAVSSMFKWYRNAEVCLAYLADVRSERQVGHVQLMREFGNSEWFKRGWTLQELLAPRLVVFLTQKWEVIGHKGYADSAAILHNFQMGPLLSREVAAVTGIPEQVLQDFGKKEEYTQGEIFGWMDGRQTSREEDMSYSLLGIFGVDMTVRYGKGGDTARERLLQKINKKPLKRKLSESCNTEDTHRSCKRPAIEANQNCSHGSMRHPLDGIGAQHHSQSDSALTTVNPDRSVMVQLRENLELLKFDQMDARHATISTAYAKTCRWILDRPEYQQWCSRANVQQHHGFLWIKGKAGTGKSTLMKCIFEEARKQSQATTVISFFFNARGETLEKSTEGMYRSLLHQLMDALPSLKALLCATSMPSKGRQAWPLDLLKDLFTQAMKGFGRNRVACYIDALDECEESEVRDLVEFLQDLGEAILDTGVEFDVCLSSRHFPQITVRHCQELILEGQEGHQQDIIDYIESKLHGGRSKLMNEIKATISRKASGIFLWVVLVVRILNEEQDRGNVHMLRKRLEEIPEGLMALFDDILWRDRRNQDDLLLTLQWILYARRPLTCEELYFGILSGSKSLPPQPWDSEVMYWKVLDASKGLAEMTKGEHPTVQFIHESVRDYLLDEGLQRLAPKLSQNFEGHSNERLKQCCQHFITREILTHLTQADQWSNVDSRTIGDIREAATRTNPLLSYAVNSIFKHADAAQRCNIPQDKFIASFDSKLWVALANTLERYAKRRHKEQVTMTYLFALHDCQHLLELAVERGHPIKEEAEKYGSALGACVGNGNISGASMLLERGADPNLKCSDGVTFLQLAYKRRFDHMIPLLLNYGCKVDTVLSEASRNGRIEVAKSIIEWEAHTDANVPLAFTTLMSALQKGHKKVPQTLLAAGIEVDDRGRPRPTVLQAAICAGFCCRSDTVSMLIDAGVSVNARGGNYGNALQAASYLGYEDIVTTLLKAGANVNAQGGLYANALQAASHHASGAIVKKLIKAGADVNAIGGRYGTALQAASLGDHRNVLLILKAGADVNCQGGNLGTALQAASFGGNDQTVLTLLNAGADVNVQGGLYGNALQAASSLGHNQIVRMLLYVGANVNAQGGQFGNALQAASAAGHVEVVQTLLRAGADANLQGGPAGHALQAARHGGHEEVVRALLDAGANVNAGERTYQTRQDHHMEVARPLLAADDSHHASSETEAWFESSDMIIDG